MSPAPTRIGPVPEAIGAGGGEGPVGVDVCSRPPHPQTSTARAPRNRIRFMRRSDREDSTSVFGCKRRVNSKRRACARLVWAMLATIALVSSRTASADQSETRTAEPDQKKPKPKKTNPEFRWDEHPSLVFSKGTHIDFKALFQGDVRDSEAPLDDGEG